MINFSSNRFDGGIFICEIQFDGVSFSDNRLIIQKKTLKWEPPTEKSRGSDGVLMEDINIALLLGGSGHQQSFIFIGVSLRALLRSLK